MDRQDVAWNGTLPETEDLRTLRAIAAEGGVNGAARTLSMPRSTVSRRLARLEEHLGTRLFHRTAQRLTLTDDGARLLERARVVLDELEALVEDARGVTSRVRGRLRVSAPLDLAAERKLWIGLVESHPEVTFEVELTNRYVDVVREGYDVALRAGRGEDQGLVSRRIGSYRLHAVASPGYVRAHGRLSEPKDLRAHSCVLLSPFSRRPGQASPRAPHRHLVFDDPHLVREAALRGLGIAILPPSLVAEDLKRRALVPVLDAYDPLEVPLYAAYPERKFLPAVVRAFIEHLARELATPPTRSPRATRKRA